jgi:hypothetical protein
MKLINNVFVKIAIVSVVFTSCQKTEFDEFEIKSGTADFSNYIAVGNSLTQGYSDGGLHNELGQQDNSYPAIIAGQIKLANPALNFVQPTVPGVGSGYIHLAYINDEIKVIKVFDADKTDNHPLAIKEDPNWVTYGADKTIKYNNMGISGIKLANVVEGGNTSANVNFFVSNVNPYARFLDWGTGSNMISYLDHIKASKATFFTNWLGNNDVLGWSTEGGDDGYEAQFNQYFSKLTDVTEFHDKYDSVLTAFKAMGAKGVCATIPDVTSIPYFKTVTLEALGKDVWFVEGPYSSTPGLVRKATDEDLLLLTASDELAKGVGLTQGNPLPHTFVLDKTEKILSQSRSNMFNEQIRTLAAKHGFALADMHAYMKTLESGLTFDGVEYSPKFIEGGVFSLDGVHPNNRGYALIANKFIETINQFYGSNLPPVIVANYRGITFPN